MANLSLDTIVSSALFFAGKWEATLKRNQSRDVLRLVLSKLWGASQGNLFHARMRCSHAALADACGLSREWVCTLIGRLRAAGWIETHAPRRADGKLQEITTFRVGRMLKRLMLMLLRSKQRSSRVNDCRQQTPKAPSKDQIAKNLHFLRELQEALARKLAPPGGKRGC